MEPQISINWLAVLASVVAAMVVGYLWYGPLFGKAWATEMKLPPDFKPTSKQMSRAMVLQILGAFLMTYVLAHDVQVWRPSVECRF